MAWNVFLEEITSFFTKNNYSLSPFIFFSGRKLCAPFEAENEIVAKILYQPSTLPVFPSLLWILNVVKYRMVCRCAEYNFYYVPLTCNILD